MARELRACRGRARQPAEEPSALPRAAERLRMAGGKRVERRAVEVDLPGRLRRRDALRRAGQAERAVAARRRSSLPEVADERLHLAAVVLDERDDALDPLGLGLLAPFEPLDEAVALLGERRGLPQQRVALAHVRRLQLREPALLEVPERGDDTRTLLARYRVGIDGGPDATRAAARDDAPQEVGALYVERREDVVPFALERAHAVAGVERRALLEETVELEVGEDRLQHERTYVVTRRQLVLRDRELLAARVCEDVVEQPGDRLASRRVAEREVLERRHVVAAREQLADRIRTVAARATDLLRVRLEPLRQVVVVDVAHVGLVDAHAERDRRDDDVAIRGSPPFLHLDTSLGAHARVVRARAGQEIGDALRRALQRDVDDRRAGRTLAQPVDEQPIAIRRANRPREQRQVRPVEPGHDRVALLDPEACADVGHDRGRRRRGEREHALGAELAPTRGELQVVGPEVVAPLGDAVRLVDREQRDLRLAEPREETLVVEALRRDVQQPELTATQAVGDIARLGGVQARVEPRRIDALTGKQVDLILHQRDQRRDDHRHAVEHQRRQLVAEALAAAGREDGERRAARKERFDHLLLTGAERRPAEAVGEKLGGGHELDATGTRRMRHPPFGR